MLKFTYLSTIFLILLSLVTTSAYARYTPALCQTDAGDYCFVVQRGETWESLWPDPHQRDLAMRLNRMNTPLHSGMQLVDPDQLTPTQMLTLIPFPQNIGYQSEKTIIVDPNQLAWAAYDADGNFLRWGPASTAKGYCPDAGGACNTPSGTFTIFRKGGAGCISSKFPIPDGGAPMPYCMFFKGGFALHGSYQVPGYNASHGCVRIFPQDAAWLNQEFINIGDTKVIIRPH